MKQAASVQIAAPRDCSAEDLDEFKRLVREGGEVNLNTFDGLVPGALALAFVRWHGELAAVGALKNPNLGYRSKVFTKAKVDNPDHYSYELGWMIVREPYRGRKLSSLAVASLVSSLGGQSAYATSRTDNHAMHVAMKNAGFVTVGNAYASDRRNASMRLFIRN